jgi:hypothetical protein
VKKKSNATDARRKKPAALVTRAERDKEWKVSDQGFLGELVRKDLCCCSARTIGGASSFARGCDFLHDFHFNT